MSIKLDEYIGRAVIRYLNGDMRLFKYYRSIALKLIEKEFIAIEDMLDKETISKLYKMVN